MEHLNTEKKLADAGFHGTDVCLLTSLFDYGMVWSETYLDTGEIAVIYCVDAHTQNDFGRCYFVTVNPNDPIEKEYGWADFDAVASYCGLSRPDWLAQPYMHCIADLFNYYDHATIFGTQYHAPFVINDPCDTFLARTGVTSCTPKQFWETYPVSHYAPFESFADAKEDLIDQIKDLEDDAAADGDDSLVEEYCQLADEVNRKAQDFEIAGPDGAKFSVSTIDGDDLHRDEFSRSPCDCCNSTLAGARYALVGYNPTADRVDDIGEVCVDCYESLMGAN